MDTMTMIKEAYAQILYGMKRVDLENENGVKISVYRMGDKQIRIDIKGE